MNDFEPEPAIRTELEVQLLRLKPQPVTEKATPADLLYRCGWEAALAAQAAAQTELPQPRFTWRAFAMGNLSGLAAGIAVVFCGMSLFTTSTSNLPNAAISRAQSPSDLQPSDGVQGMDAHATAHQPEALEVEVGGTELRIVAETPKRQRTEIFRSGGLDYLTAHRSEAAAEPIVLNDRSFGNDQRALSPLARRNWRSVLTQTSLKPRDPHPTLDKGAGDAQSLLRAHPYNIEALKELL